MSKLKTMSAEECVSEIKKNEDRRESLLEEKEPVDKELTRLYNRNEKLRNHADELIVEESKSSGKIDWEYVLECSHDESSAHYDFQEEALSEIGLISGGFYEHTMQNGISIRLHKNEPSSLSKALSGLETILPYIKPIIDDMKVIGIFEDTLSEYGIYEMYINGERNEYKVMLTVYSCTNEEASFDNLKECLEYVQHNHFYTT